MPSRYSDPYYVSNMPCAAAGYTSYRYRGRFGFVMIGAHNIADALSEASRSIAPAKPDLDCLEVWNGAEYVRASKESNNG